MAWPRVASWEEEEEFWKGKHRKKTSKSPHMSLSTSVFSGDSQKVGKHRLGSSWRKRKDVGVSQLSQEPHSLPDSKP